MYQHKDDHPLKQMHSKQEPGEKPGSEHSGNYLWNAGTLACIPMGWRVYGIATKRWLIFLG